MRATSPKTGKLRFSGMLNIMGVVKNHSDIGNYRLYRSLIWAIIKSENVTSSQMACLAHIGWFSVGHHACRLWKASFEVFVLSKLKIIHLNRICWRRTGTHVGRALWSIRFSTSQTDTTHWGSHLSFSTIVFGWFLFRFSCIFRRLITVLGVFPWCPVGVLYPSSV